MVLRLLGFLVFYGLIIWTTMQEDSILWLVSALCSILLMHVLSNMLNVGGLSQLGLQWSKNGLKFLLIGCLIGIGYQLIRFGLLTGAGIGTIHPIPLDPGPLIVSTVILLVSTSYIGFAEEIVFRGYLIRILPSSLSNMTLALISSILFTAGHLVNGHFEMLRIIELLFVGLFFATIYIATRSLWFVAGIHWFWDFAWFYLGANGGPSSAKLVDVTIHHAMISRMAWIDAGMAVAAFGIAFFVAWRPLMNRETTIHG